MALEDSSNVYKQLLKHPLRVLSIEAANRFSTTRRVILSKVKGGKVSHLPKLIVYYES